MTGKKILIAIPTYREAQNIVELIRQIKKNAPNEDILIINDKSDDRTLELINDLNDQRITVIERPQKNGLGSAHVMSVIYSIKFNYNILITMDADFSHDPIYIPKIIEKAGINNFVIGSRFVEDENKKISRYTSTALSNINWYGNKALTLLLNFLFKLNIKDTQAGYKCFKSSSLKNLKLESKRYEVETEMIIKSKHAKNK